MKVRNTSPVDSLIRTLKILSENPSLFAIAFLWAVFGQLFNLGYLGQHYWTLQYLALQFLWLSILALIYPFVKGGFFKIIIRAQEAKEENWLPVFKEGGRDKFVPLLLGMILYTGMAVVFFIGSYILVLLGAPVAAFISLLVLELHRLVGLALMILTLLAFLSLFNGLLLGFNMFIQFYDIGIVAKSYGVVDSFKQSYRFTRSRFNSVLGFTIVKYGVVLVLYLPIMLYSLKTSPISLGQITPAPYLDGAMVLGSIILGTIYTSFTFAYHSTFYVQTVTEEGVYESKTRILLKLCGIGFVALILLAGLITITYVLAGLSLEELARLQAEELTEV
jgi:hypothetical protein